MGDFIISGVFLTCPADLSVRSEDVSPPSWPSSAASHSGQCRGHTDLGEHNMRMLSFNFSFSPIAQETGLPPKVEKYPPSLSEMSWLQITAPIGYPFPSPFPMVTISGTRPYSMKAHMFVPVLPRPDWTSSAMIRPPCCLTTLVSEDSQHQQL